MATTTALLKAARRAPRKVPALAPRLKAAAIAHAIFGGRKLSHAGAIYIYDAQVYFGTLLVEAALDGRNLFEGA